MEKDFDFKELGKRMPYKVPDAYFKELEETITTRTGIRKSQKHRLWIYIHTLAAVAVLAGLFFLPAYWHRDGEQALRTSPEEQALRTSVDKQPSGAGISDASYTVPAPAIEELSDEELEEIIGLSSIDVFLN